MRRSTTLLLAFAWTVTGRPAIADCANGSASDLPIVARPAAEIPCLTSAWKWNEPGLNFLSSIHWNAAVNESSKALQDLLKAGADPNTRDFLGWTPLHCAAKYNEDPDALHILLDAGAAPDARDDRGFTPLHYAAMSNPRVEILQVLLDAGADPNALTEAGWTPLDWVLARHVSSPGGINTLLNAGGTAAVKRVLEK